MGREVFTRWTDVRRVLGLTSSYFKAGTLVLRPGHVRYPEWRSRIRIIDYPELREDMQDWQAEVLDRLLDADGRFKTLTVNRGRQGAKREINDHLMAVALASGTQALFLTETHEIQINYPGQETLVVANRRMK